MRTFVTAYPIAFNTVSESMTAGWFPSSTLVFAAHLFTLNLRSSAPAATARVRACVRSCVRDVHAASQKRPPRAETGKTSAAQSMSKAVRGPPIVERRGSIVPPIPSRPHHAASQKRPPRAEPRKTGPAQSMSKVVRGLPIVERRGSIALGLRRAPGPFHHESR